MIRGSVSAAFKAVARLRLRGPSGAVADFDTLVDTGFTGSIALPAATVAGLD